MQDVKVGDIVRLVSGGPEMTVEAIYKNYSGVVTEIGCIWFSMKNEVVSCKFKTGTLEKVPPIISRVKKTEDAPKDFDIDSVVDEISGIYTNKDPI